MNRQSAAIVGYEARLWDMANTLRGSIDASEYKHIVLALLCPALARGGWRRLLRRLWFA